MSRLVALLVNPSANRGRAARRVEPLRAALHAAGLEVVLLAGGSAMESVELSRSAAADGVTAVVAVGGDGLVHWAVQGLAGSDTPLAVVPAGTGNDFAEVLGMPAEPAAVAAMVAAGRARRVDAGLVSFASERGTCQRWWAGVLCAGFDSVVNERANLMRWPRGPRRYDAAILAELYRLRPRPMTITVDGQRLDTEVTLVAVGNGPQYGGGLRICPTAVLDDGLLDITVVGPVTRTELVRIKPRVRTGAHLGHPAVQVLRGQTVRLEAAGLVGYADGERVAPLPLDLACVPGALCVLRP